MFEIAPFVVGAEVGRTCTRCGDWKPLDQFNADASARLGVRCCCKVCQRAEVLEYARNHQEERREYGHLYRRATGEERAAHRRLEYWRNPEQHRERARRWLSEHPDYMRVQNDRRRARVAAARGAYTPADIEAIRIAQGNRCYICHKKLKKYHIDHFIPLAKGGANDPGNLRLACPACNLHKGAKHPHDLGMLI